MLPLTSTTKPGDKYRSIKNPATYEALRKQGMSKQRAARISNAQSHKDAGAVAGAPVHGPGGLLSTPGLGTPRRRKGKRWGMRTKDKQIVGNLYRSDTGKFTAGGGSPSSAPKRTTAKKPKKIAQTPDQKRQARATEHAQNQAKVLSGLNIAPDGQQALEALRQGAQPDPKALERGGFEQAGLVEQASDGSYRMTASGRALLTAAGSGDQGKAGDIISGARDRTATRQQRQAERAKRQQEVATRRAQAQARRDAKKMTTKAETYGGMKRSNLDENVFAGPERSFPIKTAQDVKDAVMSLGRTKHDKAAVKRGIIRRAKAIGAMDALPDSWRVATKAQSDQDKAMFANMGSSGGGGGGSGGGKATGGQGGLWAKGPSGKRTPQAASAAQGGGAKPSADKPKGEDGYWSKGAMEKRDQERHAAGKKKYDDEIKKPLTDEEKRHAQTIAYGDRSLEGFGQGANALDGKTKNRARSILTEQHDKAIADGKYDEAAKHKREIQVLDEANKIIHDTQQRTERGSQLHSELQRAKKLYAKKPNDKNREALESSWSAYADHTPGIRGNEARARDLMGIPKITEKSFIVYKDHTGAHRWLARTTTAYRDRDQEIISSDALDQDSQRMTASKSFGPLRYWHVGQPDPLDVTTPWGPGLDIGDCDYSMLIGRTRVESGTFRDPAIAQAIAAKAEQYELSPGFFHPLDQPDRGGIFHAIRTFERSIVPIKYGRASNLFTGLAVKEQRMNLDEMERRFKTAIADLGLNAEQATTLGMQLVQTEKAATEQGIAFKSDDAPVETEYPDVVINGITYKAAPPPMAMDAEDDPALGGDSGVDEAAEGEPPMDAQPEGDYIGDMSVDDFKSMMSEILAPIAKMQDMVKSIGDMHGELKGMYGGVAQKDDAQYAELVTLKAQMTDLQAKIDQIEGNQPNTILPDEVAAALKSAGPATPQKPDDPAKQAALSDPARPFAWLGMQTFPELYQNGENT